MPIISHHSVHIQASQSNSGQPQTDTQIFPVDIPPPGSQVNAFVQVCHYIIYNLYTSPC